ncbi:heterokaryon incompatibility protein-domain-containing protein, partial [Lasiosphaeria hispida]
MLDSLPLPTQGQYTYKPLEIGDSIRLLTLHLGTRDGLIDCTLSHTPIKDCQYRALSYEWGDDGDVGGIITVNGLLFPRRIQKNLESALREIRSEKEDVVLWIDALCINQGDATEKGHQVAMMRKIFREADSVIAWLGPEADNSEMVMDLIADKTTLRETAEHRELSDAELEALTPVAYRSYWSRVWIIQEFFLAKNLEIRCGTKAVSYDEFKNYLEAMSLPHSQFRDSPWNRGSSSPPAHTHMFARLVPQPTGPDSILFNTHLFSWLRRSYDCKSQASNPRDYIYALLGVSDDCTHGELVPDYDDREETVR